MARIVDEERRGGRVETRGAVGDEREDDKRPKRLVLAPIVDGQPERDGAVEAKVDHREEDRAEGAAGEEERERERCE